VQPGPQSSPLGLSDQIHGPAHSHSVKAIGGHWIARLIA
jgi:hypothetical protein